MKYNRIEKEKHNNKCGIRVRCLIRKNSTLNLKRPGLIGRAIVEKLFRLGNGLLSWPSEQLRVSLHPQQRIKFNGLI